MNENDFRLVQVASKQLDMGVRVLERCEDSRLMFGNYQHIDGI